MASGLSVPALATAVMVTLEHRKHPTATLLTSDCKGRSSTCYKFNMLTPRGYGIFFTKLRSGELVGFRSELDVAMARATVGT